MSPRIEEALPKYVQIANYLRTQILQGELKPGDEIPSERQLVEDWQVSRPTATRALSALRVEGLVEARQGSGTFVRAQPKLYPRARDRYAQSRATVGMHAPGEQPRITSAGLEAAPEHVAAGLGIDPELLAIRRQRVVFDGDIPVEMSTSWFTQDLAASAPRLLQHSPIREGTLAYVEQATGRRGRSAKDRVSARLATPEEAEALQLGNGPAAVLLVHHVTYDTTGEPIEFIEATYPPGQWAFEDDYPIGG
jgi:DNA-binding GntR family transcriptional regulator